MTTLENAFRAAWNETQGDTFAARLARRSLVASAVQVPELANLLPDFAKDYSA